RRGDYVKVLFCIDTAADACSMTISFAESKGIAVPRQADGMAAGLLGATSVPRRIGAIDVHLFGEQFRWPCLFLETTAPASQQPYALIGRIGFIASFNACVKRPWCCVERRSDHLPFWRRVLARLPPSKV